jgi:Kef-type K+ transport system membrane component KefB
MSSAFFATGLVIAAASVLGAVARNFKQPLILAYILVGIIAASFGIFQGEELHDTFNFLAELGIAFLLFLIGLELKFNDVKYLGKIAVLTGLGQIIFTSVAGFLLARLIGFGGIEAFYIALALTFSSTIIIVKLLTEKRDLDSLYGKVAVGFLLVQDLVAILALIVISSFGNGDLTAGKFVFTFVEGAIFVAVTLLLSRYVAEHIFNAVAKNVELLFLSSIAWAMIFSSLAVALGFSIEIGAFVAGVGLATLKEEHQIASRIRPLRDLFIVIFFITLGLKLTFSNILSTLSPALILSLFVLIGNPLIMMIIMGYLGFRKRTSFMASMAVAQISEFSLVIVALGLRVGHISQEVVSLITLVGIITISTSSYLILNSTKLYKLFGKYLSIFQRKVLTEKVLEGEKEFSDHTVLIGSGRLGSEILRSLKESGKEVVVIDFDPIIVRHLIDQGVDVIFGDINDQEIQEAANLKRAKLIVSTMFDTDDTEELLGLLKEKNIRVPVVVTSAETKWALRFYQQGSDYVIIPRVLSSHQVALLLEDSNIDQLLSGKLRERHLKEIREKNKFLEGN